MSNKYEKNKYFQAIHSKVFLLEFPPPFYNFQVFWETKTSTEIMHRETVRTSLFPAQCVKFEKKKGVPIT